MLAALVHLVVLHESDAVDGLIGVKQEIGLGTDTSLVKCCREWCQLPVAFFQQHLSVHCRKRHTSRLFIDDDGEGATLQRGLAIGRSDGYLAGLWLKGDDKTATFGSPVGSLQHPDNVGLVERR